MKRGDVWWVYDPAVGRRPHLVLTRDAAVPVLNQLIAVPATRTMRGLPTEVELGRDDGMPDVCVLSLDNATLVPKAYFQDRICTLGAERMARVCRALGIATGCAT
ncbi:MAG: type II toxin-antitoxin system PemK/MazF family toxin [Gaiellaceae bacterium]